MIPAAAQAVQDFDVDALGQLLQINSRADDFDLLVKLPRVEFVPAAPGFLHLLDGIDEVVIALEHGA